MTEGGVIYTGPLKGTAFGPGGTPEGFTYGDYVGSLFMVGGSGGSFVKYGSLAPIQNRKSGFAHLEYDIVPGRYEEIDQPDVLIVEGLNVLQGNPTSANLFVSDFFDFSIYVDADEALIKKWYIDRFLLFRESVFTNPKSYFRAYADLDVDAAREVAVGIWDSINKPNLHSNIAPTRSRAKCILTKRADHQVARVALTR